MLRNMDDLIDYLRGNKLCLFREAIEDQNPVKVVVIDSEILFSYKVSRGNNGKFDDLRTIGEIPKRIREIIFVILERSKLNHFVGEFVIKGDEYLLARINYVLPKKELLSLGFDPFRLLCEKICSGTFSYMIS